MLGTGQAVMVAIPKPIRRVRTPSPLRARRWGVHRRPRSPWTTELLALPKPVTPKKNKHARRERLWGKMMFLKTQACMVLEAFWDEFTNEDVAAAGAPTIPTPCSSRRIQVMHLRKEASQARPDDERTASGCEGHHHGIDGDLGGRDPWYVVLGRVRQRRFRDRLAALGNAAWLALSPEERADWDARAAARRGTGNPAA
jgi:hypothetical protein